MISVNISKGFSHADFKMTIKECLLHNIRSIEMNVQKNKNHELIVLYEQASAPSSEQSKQEVLLEGLFQHVKDENLSIEMILNLVEPDLEHQVNDLAKAYHLNKQVKYAGKINPTSLSLWDRLKILYDVENCLPTIYHFNPIKDHHFDVIEYFKKKYQVPTIRFHLKGLSKEVLNWAQEKEIRLSIYGVTKEAEVEELFRLGVKEVSVTYINAQTPDFIR